MRERWEGIGWQLLSSHRANLNRVFHFLLRTEELLQALHFSTELNNTAMMKALVRVTAGEGSQSVKLVHAVAAAAVKLTASPSGGAAEVSFV